MHHVKYAYKASQTDVFGSVVMPTGKQTRFAGSRYGAEVLAKEYGFTSYDIGAQGICMLYQSRIAHYKAQKNYTRLAKLHFYGAIRYIKGRLSNG